MRGVKGLIVAMAATILALLLFPNQSFAQTQAEEITRIFSEEQTVVTATKREQKITESPSAISVITSEDLGELGITKASEAFIMTPGTQLGYVTSNWHMAGGIRGFHRVPANKIMSLINGVPITYEANQTPAITTLPIALEEIERIEVLRGPGSSLYGPNAMFGVINIITKKPEDTKGNLISYRMGEDGLTYGTFMHGDTIKDKLNYRMVVNWDQRDNFGYLALTDDPTDINGRISATADYIIDDNSQLDFFGSYVDEKKTQTLAVFPIEFKGEHVYYGQLKYTSKEPNIMVRGYYDYNSYWDSGWGLTERLFYLRMGTQGIDVQHIWEPFNNDTLVWGVNFAQITCDGYMFQEKRRHDTSGIFFDNTYNLKENFSINSGLRLDHNPNTGDNLSHRLAFLYTPVENHHLRFTWGSSFRNPDFYESYGAYNVLTSPDPGTGISNRLIYAGDETLKPEKAETFELGYIGKLGEKLNLEANVFYTKLMDYIDPVTTIDPSGYPTIIMSSQASNFENLYQYGTEIELKYPFTDWLSGILNYTYLEQWEEQCGLSSDFLAQTPQHMLNAQLRAKFENGISTNLSLHYRGTTEWLRTGAFPITGDSRGVTNVGGKTKDYLIANLNLGYKFKFMDNDTEFRLAFFDLFDKEFDDYPVDTYSVGRRVTATLTYKF